MGGVVARGTVQITDIEEREHYFASFTNTSIPWNGVSFAALGAIELSVPVPCWLHMRPDSDFIRKILSDLLPVPHLLISTENRALSSPYPAATMGGGLHRQQD